MNFIQTQISGLYIIENFNAPDDRGSFVKLYNKEIFEEQGIYTNFEESYYSISNKNVVRGMHFQQPPFEHDKLIHVISGEIEDVILDLRKSSSTYGKAIGFNLDVEGRKSLFIPKGCAHGFKSLKDHSTMLYYVEKGYNKESDTGVLWNSIDYDWKISNPIISERDKNFCEFTQFQSQFE